MPPPRLFLAPKRTHRRKGTDGGILTIRGPVLSRGADAAGHCSGRVPSARKHSLSRHSANHLAESNRLVQSAVAANGLARKAIPGAAGSPVIERVVSRYGMRLGGSRFVTGEHLDECVAAIRELNRRGMKANSAFLGEAVTSRDEAMRAAHEYGVLLKRLTDEGLRANIAVKLTLLGPRVDPELAQANLERLLSQAPVSGTLVRIDMEESRNVDMTLRMYRRMRELSHDNVGAVLQAYLYRTRDDLESLLPLNPNLRLVTGAYIEPHDVAFPRKRT